MKFRLAVNGSPQETEASADTPLLWVLRENLGLTGTKFGCGAGLCGACTVHIDGEAVRSCSVPVETVGDAAITTIEGLSSDRSHPVQLAWIAEQVPQCGYCQSGMIMAVSALLASTPKPTRQEVRDAITNLCRCGTYPRIERAILELAGR
jgi:isoquinoline 1-oxidoreductase subunit alpha